MSQAQLAGGAQTAQTTLQRIVERINALTDRAMGLNSKMSSFRYRVLGNQDDGEPISDGAEPVRSDIEEVDHRLNNLEWQLEEMGRQFADIESL